jgi:hypothetical protein
MLLPMWPGLAWPLFVLCEGRAAAVSLAFLFANAILTPAHRHTMNSGLWLASRGGFPMCFVMANGWPLRAADLGSIAAEDLINEVE